MEHNIKLGLTLYSFSSEYINQKLSLEEILQKAKDMGYTGIEFIPAQMAPTYPFLDDAWLAEFKSLIAQYALEPVCWSAYLDMGLVTGRDLTEDEIMEYTINDLIYAKKAGFPMVRSQYSMTPKVFRAMIPYCKKLGVKLTIEMHHPHHPDMPIWQEYIAIMRGEGKGVLGLVPDFGIFIDRAHKLWLDQALEMGFDPARLKAVQDKHLKGASLEDATAGLMEHEIQITKDMYAMFNKPALPHQIRDIIDVSFYMHGKFYYAEEGQNDLSIPYDEILTAIASTGYEGFIACEYEGHHFTDAIPAEQQLTRYVAMCNRILAE